MSLKIARSKKLSAFGFEKIHRSELQYIFLNWTTLDSWQMRCIIKVTPISSLTLPLLLSHLIVCLILLCVPLSLSPSPSPSPLPYLKWCRYSKVNYIVKVGVQQWRFLYEGAAAVVVVIVVTVCADPNVVVVVVVVVDADPDADVRPEKLIKQQNQKHLVSFSCIWFCQRERERESEREREREMRRSALAKILLQIKYFYSGFDSRLIFCCK